MISESSSVALISVFCSFALIFFLAYYISKISGYDLNEELNEGKGYELFHTNETNEKFIDNEGSNDGNAEDRQNFMSRAFVKIFEEIQSFLSEFFKKVSYLVIIGDIFFGIFVLLVLDEFIGSWYATMAFLFGSLFCIIFFYFLKNISFIACCKMLLQASKDSQKPLAFAYYTGFAIMMLFFGFTCIFLMIMMAIYRRVYLSDNPSLKDYGKAFVLLYGGYTLGYSFTALFYRGSSGIFQAGVNTGAELLGKSDEGIAAEDQRNPCSLPNRVADILGLYTSTILDITCCFLLCTMTAIVMICESKEFVESKEFYFPFLLIVFNIIISYISSLFGIYFEIFEVTDSPFFTTKQTRLQTFLTAFLNIFIISFLPYGCFANDFSVLSSEFDTTKDPLLNLRKTGTARGWIIFCLLAGYFLEKIIVVIFEYFSSHYYNPVSSMIRVCETGPCLNIISSNILSYLIYPLTILFISFTIFLTYGILGYQGVGFAFLGVISNLIPSVCIFSVGSLSFNAYKLGNLIGASRAPIERVFNISWSARNHCSHLFAILYLSLILGGFAALGALLGFLNDAKLLELKSLQFFGLIFGFSYCYLLNGIIISGVQYITQNAFHLASNQLLRIVGIRENTALPEYEDLFSDTRMKSSLLILLPIFLDILVYYLFGMLLGASFMMAETLGFLLAASFIVFQAYVSGNALYNSKILIDNTDKIQREGTIYASASIAELYSLSFKDSSPILVVFICFNAAFLLLGGRYFENSAYISEAVGLK